MTEAPLLNVSTVHLAYLVAVSHHRTWGEAAAELKVTPSALSQGMAELERRLGLTLFRWEGRRRVPLGHTARVVDYAERVLATTGDLGRWIGAVRSGHLGRLRIGMIDTAAVHYFGGVLSELRRTRPDVDLHLSVAPTGELLEALASGRIDVAVCVGGDRREDLEVTELLTEALGVYAPERADTADPAHWGPWLLFPHGSRTRRLVEDRLRALGAPMEVEAESHQPDVLREMVRMGLGWSVLPVVQAETGPHPLRRAVADPIVTRTLVATWRTGDLVHPVIEALVGMLRDLTVARSA